MIKSNEYFNVLSTREVPALGWFSYAGWNGKAENETPMIVMDVNAFDFVDEMAGTPGEVGKSSTEYINGEVTGRDARGRAAKDFNVIPFGKRYTALIDAEVDGDFTYALPDYAANTLGFGWESLVIITADSPGADHVVLQEVKRINTNDSAVYVIQGGWGSDGGFGDYAMPYFEAPMKFNNSLLFMTDADEADTAVAKLNDAAFEAFYSVGEHNSYDGKFPYEYTVTTVPGIMSNHEPVTGDRLIYIVTQLDERVWYEQ